MKLFLFKCSFSSLILKAMQNYNQLGYDTMIINWQEEITKIDPDIKFRAQGGWLKTVEKLDKSVSNGYSLVGDFVQAGNFEAIKKEQPKNLNKTTDYSDSKTDK